MRANRAAHERYARAFYPVWTHPEMLRQLFKARFGYRNDIARHPRRALPRQLQPLAHGFSSRPTSRLTPARSTLMTRSAGYGRWWSRPAVRSRRGRRSRSQPDSQGRPLGERAERERQRGRDDRGCRGRRGDPPRAVGRALGEPTVAAVRDLRREERFRARGAPAETGTRSCACCCCGHAQGRISRGARLLSLRPWRRIRAGGRSAGARDSRSYGSTRACRA